MMSPGARNGRKSNETVLNQQFWKSSCVGTTKLSYTSTQNGRESFETVLKLPFWRGSCAGGTKLMLDRDPRSTKWTKVTRNCIGTTILKGSCAEDTKLSPGPDNDPGYTKWTRVTRNCIGTIILDGVLVQRRQTKPGSRS